MARSSRPRLVTAAFAGVLVLAGACPTNPVTGRKDVALMSEAQEIEIGRKMHPQILQEYGRYDDELLQQYVNSVGQRIGAASHRPGLQYTFTVLDSADVNAFALPGGYIYITRGIMAYLNSEAELAAVLGHEVGHVTARHSVRQQSGATAAGVGAMIVGILTGSADLANVANAAGTALVSGYGRDMELEADQIGAEYLNRIGYTRLKEVVRAAAKVQNTEDRPDNRDAYLARIDGMPMGDSRAQGVVRGSRFYHGDLGFTLAFPTGWVVENKRASVLAYPESKDAMITVSAGAPPQGVAPKEYLGRMLQGTPTVTAAPLDVNGLDGYTATVRSTALPWGNQGPARVAVVYYNNLAYVFKGAPRQAAGLSSFDRVFNSSLNTFRRLRDNEFPQAEPDKIRIVRAAPGTTVEQLARNTPITKYPTERLRLLNDLYPDKQPVAGQKLKVVQ